MSLAPLTELRTLRTFPPGTPVSEVTAGDDWPEGAMIDVACGGGLVIIVEQPAPCCRSTDQTRCRASATFTVTTPGGSAVRSCASHLAGVIADYDDKGAGAVQVSFTRSAPRRGYSAPRGPIDFIPPPSTTRLFPEQFGPLADVDPAGFVEISAAPLPPGWTGARLERGELDVGLATPREVAAGSGIRAALLHTPTRDGRTLSRLTIDSAAPVPVLTRSGAETIGTVRLGLLNVNEVWAVVDDPGFTIPDGWALAADIEEDVPASFTTGERGPRISGRIRSFTVVPKAEAPWPHMAGAAIVPPGPFAERAKQIRSIPAAD